MSMASIPATLGPDSPQAPEVSELVERSSTAPPPRKSTVDTPPSTPIAAPSSPNTVAASDSTEKMPAVDSAQVPHAPPGTAKSDSDPEDGEIVEDGPPVVTEADTIASMDVTIKVDVHEIATTEQTSMIECEQPDSHAAIDVQTVDQIKDTVTDELLEPEGEGSRSTEDEDLYTTIREPAILSAADLFERQEVERPQIRDQMQIGDVKGKEVTADDSDNNSLGDEEDTAVESQKHEDVAAASSRSLPPHMRPAFKTSAFPHPSTPDARVSYCDLGK